MDDIAFASFNRLAVLCFSPFPKSSQDVQFDLFSSRLSLLLLGNIVFRPLQQKDVPPRLPPLPPRAPPLPLAAARWCLLFNPQKPADARSNLSGMFLQKLLLLLLLALSMLFPRLLLRELPHHPELVVVVVKGRGRERSARPGAEDIAFLPKTHREGNRR